jgi:hypothetical protein
MGRSGSARRLRLESVLWSAMRLWGTFSCFVSKHCHVGGIGLCTAGFALDFVWGAKTAIETIPTRGCHTPTSRL